ncbi:hypothetical protein [Agarilytica rhodophyticola]|nr:hypothetical protein [Agarilytica rhodophyticola]
MQDYTEELLELSLSLELSAQDYIDSETIDLDESIDDYSFI